MGGCICTYLPRATPTGIPAWTPPQHPPGGRRAECSALSSPDQALVPGSLGRAAGREGAQSSTATSPLTWMLSSTFFHWQNRVNLSL